MKKLFLLLLLILGLLAFPRLLWEIAISRAIWEGGASIWRDENRLN